MRLIDADALITWFEEHFDDEYVTVGFVTGLIKDEPTIEPDWAELMVICDNCGHAIHIKRADAKPTIEPEQKRSLDQNKR